MTDTRKPLPDKEAADKLAVDVKEALAKLGITAFVMGGRMDGGHLAIIMKCSPIEAIVLDDAIHESVVAHHIGPAMDNPAELIKSLAALTKAKCDACPKKDECDRANAGAISECGHA